MRRVRTARRQPWSAAEQHTRSRTVWAVVVTVLAAVFAYRAWRGLRAG